MELVWGKEITALSESKIRNMTLPEVERISTLLKRIKIVLTDAFVFTTCSILYPKGKDFKDFWTLGLEEEYTDMKTGQPIFLGLDLLLGIFLRAPLDNVIIWPQPELGVLLDYAPPPLVGEIEPVLKTQIERYFASYETIKDMFESRKYRFQGDVELQALKTVVLGFDWDDQSDRTHIWWSQEKDAPINLGEVPISTLISELKRLCAEKGVEVLTLPVFVNEATQIMGKDFKDIWNIRRTKIFAHITQRFPQIVGILQSYYLDKSTEWLDKALTAIRKEEFEYAVVESCKTLEALLKVIYIWDRNEIPPEKPLGTLYNLTKEVIEIKLNPTINSAISNIIDPPKIRAKAVHATDPSRGEIEESDAVHLYLQVQLLDRYLRYKLGEKIKKGVPHDLFYRSY